MPRSCANLLVLLAVSCGEPSPAEPPAAEPETEAPVETEAEVEEDIEEEAPEPVAPTTHELLVLVSSDEALLPSEMRLAEFLEARMRRNRRDVELRPATEEEAALASGEAGVLPATFGEARRVLFLHFADPRTLPDGDLRSRGIDGVVLLSLPSTTPALEARIDGGWRLEDERWATWIAGLLREAEGS
jgi:hypothetical protein